MGDIIALKCFLMFMLALGGFFVTSLVIGVTNHYIRMSIIKFEHEQWMEDRRRKIIEEMYRR